MSVREYLFSDGIGTGAAAQFRIDWDVAHSLICQTCLIHLFRLKTVDSLDHISNRSFSLITYAGTHWINHYRAQGSRCKDLNALLFDFFRCTDDSFKNWTRLFGTDGFGARNDPVRPKASILSSFSDIQWFRMVNLANAGRSASGNQQLYYSVVASAPEIVEFLLRDGGDMNGEDGATYLHQAAFTGDAQIIKMLLDCGVHVDVLDSLERTPLQRASFRRYHDIVQMLIRAGADVNASMDGFSCLRMASDAGDLELEAAAYRGRGHKWS